jgi:hypothetical protein
MSTQPQIPPAAPHQQRPVQRAFVGRGGRPGLAGSPLARKKRGRPPLTASGAQTAVERKRRQRAKEAAEVAAEALQQAIAEAIKEQEIDEKTGGRGAGMNIPQAPHGLGRIITGGFNTVNGVLDAIDAGAPRSTGGGKRLKPRGTTNNIESRTQQTGSKDPKSFGPGATRREERRRREWYKEEKAKKSIRSSHWCKLCPDRPQFKEFRDAFLHVTERHPEKLLADLGVGSIHVCFCGAEFEDYKDAFNHALSSRESHEAPAPKAQALGIS